jgi:hypothetical protein
MGCDQESFTLVWLSHQLLSRFLPNSPHKLPVVHGTMGCDQESYHTPSVVVTPAAVLVPTQLPLVLSFMPARPRGFHFVLLHLGGCFAF